MRRKIIVELETDDETYQRIASAISAVVWVAEGSSDGPPIAQVVVDSEELADTLNASRDDEFYAPIT